jgi:hypothetical protein
LGNSLDKALVDSLNNLHKLQCLDIEADGGRVDLMREGWVPPPQLRMLRCQGSTCSFLTMPTWINSSSLCLLSYLSIRVDEVRPGDIRLLGMLPSLRYLFMGCDTSFSEEDAVKMSVTTADAFPCVTHCYFYRIAAVPSIFPQGAMPRVKHLRFDVPAVWIARRGSDFDLGMRHLPSLEDVSVELFSEEATDAEAEEAEAALKAAVEDHPNRPALRIEDENFDI